MSQAEKSELYQRAKDAGLVTKPYRNYTEAELRALVPEPTTMEFKPPAPPVFETPTEPAAPELPPEAVAAVHAAAPARAPRAGELPAEWAALPLIDEPSAVAGLTSGPRSTGKPIRRDSQGRVWFVDEVRKTLMAKPRARRRERYVNTGVEVKTINYEDGSSETVEIAGQMSRSAEATITLPSYQVGIYVNPALPMFRVHCYNGAEGFDFEDVVRYWGGEEMVPSRCQRIYVETSLCYDKRSVIAAIEDAYREIQLTKAGHAPSMVRR